MDEADQRPILIKMLEDVASVKTEQDDFGSIKKTSSTKIFSGFVITNDRI